MNAYIIDDDFVIRKALSSMVEEAGTGLVKVNEVINEISFYKELAGLKIQNSDLFFIDIELKTYFTGIDLAKEVRKKNPYCSIIFVTSFESRGLEIINENILPLAYLVKSKDKQYMKSKIEDILHTAIRNSSSEDEYILFQERGYDQLIKEKEILYISPVKGLKSTLLVKSFDSEVMVTGSLKKIKELLQDDLFYKDMKSFIINMRNIKTVYRTEGVVLFQEDSTLTVGKISARKLSKGLKEVGLHEFIH